ncbi:MAG: acyl-CoA dehydratase activase [Bacillota bacterium]|jgi:predicted CoA-substrate-specific enzyme activase|nr:acyl-CoA dehydratase activase [Bacillota bacterium]NLH87528.1 2-hydroxyglutaryl-CoA dehydratase [Bacillota bacterium]
MYVAGVDVGSTATKAVVLNDGKLAGKHVMPTGTDHVKTASACLDAAVRAAGDLISRDLAYVVSTGYGRAMVDIADKTVTEITCHARGARAFVESAHVVVDIGGQDSKVIRLDEDGMVADFVMNDKCAAGTGRFLEVMAERLDVPLSDFGKMSRAARKRAMISSTCTVFAESEVISLLSHGVGREPIIRGLCDAVADRLVGMVHRVGLAPDVVMTGGVSQNDGVRLSLERKLALRVIVPSMSQYAGAYGAAVIAQESAAKGR